MEDAGDFDVIEISPLSLPPDSHSSRKRKRRQQEAVLPEIIDVDDDDDDDVVIQPNEKVIVVDKLGKAMIEDGHTLFYHRNDFAPPPPLQSQQLGSSAKSQFKSTTKQSFTMNTSSAGLRSLFTLDRVDYQWVAGGEQSRSEILRKWKLFKHFDIVEDHSDHYYTYNKRPSSEQGTNQKKWAKAIQDEWKRLNKDLRDTTIYVRAYESRMDLLRAVIVGADGTPYHDGLFCFDFFFPDLYPNVPPEVHLDHRDHLLLSPILGSGYVCLSLLFRGGGLGGMNKSEMWQPGVSNMMQVLLSLQALVLCEKPLYTDSMYDWDEMIFHRKNKEECIGSLRFSESVFLQSLQLMVHTMKEPPKHFEEFVMGHFHRRAKSIMAACKAYMSGVQVGRYCTVVKGKGKGKGARSGVGEGGGSSKSCQPEFRDSLAEQMNELVEAFTKIGVKKLEKGG